jgi:tRNA/tmRNA/rRNA uracil-C5-methylase (TrmA/RlmC/RlmD family)
VAGAPEVVGELIPCPAPYGYRNRIMIRRQWDKFQQKAIYGFLRAESRLVVDLERCEIAEEVLNEQLAQVRENPPPRNMQKVVLRMMPDDWELHRDSFFQNNFSLLPKLVETVRGRLADAGGGEQLEQQHVGDGAVHAGRRLLHDRHLTTLDLAAILDRAREWQARIAEERSR